MYEKKPPDPAILFGALTHCASICVAMSIYTTEHSTHDHPDQLLSVTQAARSLGVHISTIRRWIKQGKLPAYRVGDKGVRVRSGDLALLLTPLTQLEEKGGHEL